MRPSADGNWWPTANDVIEIHRRLALRELRSSQVRADTESLIDGAISRIRNRLHYGETMDDCQMAAYLAFDIANVQAFADMNKRTAASMMAEFLRQRGWIVRTLGSEIPATFIVKSATSPDRDDLAVEFAAFLRLNVQKIGPYAIRRAATS